MATPRKNQVDLEVTSFYHLSSRTVRQEALLGDKSGYRKLWIELRIKRLSQVFAIDILSYAVMDNHMHLLVKVDKKRAESFSAEEVLRRWMIIHPPKKVDRDDEQAVNDWIAKEIKENRERVEQIRARLYDMGWLMKELKEPIAKLANKEDQVTGHFWEGRYKSVAVLDTFALFATSVYIDLNPVAAGIAKVPEMSEYTSLRCRIESVKAAGRMAELRQSMQESYSNCPAISRLEQQHWLMPIEDWRGRSGQVPEPIREGGFDSLPLGKYLWMVDEVGRWNREGKARIDPQVASVLERLEIDQEPFLAKIQEMFEYERFRGHAFSGDREVLRQWASKRGQRHLVNHCPTGCKIADGKPSR